jgi:hypothetical protein
VARAESEQGKERAAHSSGQIDVSSVELKRFAAEKYIESAPATLVRLEKRDVAQHLGRFVAIGQNDLPIGPKSQSLGGLA